MKKTLLTLAFLVSHSFAVEVYATFNILALKEASLGPKVGGTIKENYVDVGSIVKKGDILGKLDNEKQKISLDLSKVQKDIATLAFKNSQTTLKRYSSIKDVINKENYDKLKLDRDVKYFDLQNATKNVALQKEKYEDTLIKAPFSGVITEKSIDEGNYVDSKSVVFKMVDNSKVKLVLEFDEKYWKQVKVGQNFRYRVDGDKETYIAKIDKLYPTSNTKNRKIKAEVLAQGFIPGLFGDGYIIIEE